LKIKALNKLVGAQMMCVAKSKFVLMSGTTTQKGPQNCIICLLYMISVTMTSRLCNV